MLYKENKGPARSSSSVTEQIQPCELANQAIIGATYEAIENLKLSFQWPESLNHDNFPNTETSHYKTKLVATYTSEVLLYYCCFLNT